MAKKKYYIILDTETCGPLWANLPYDIGWTICDSKGEIIRTRSFVVNEVFYGEPQRMATAYYKEKLPKYYEALEKGEMLAENLAVILETLTADRNEFENCVLTAHNARFDKRALENACCHILGSIFAMPSITEMYDTQIMAKETICKQKKYEKFCIENNLLTPTGRIPQNAQALFRFISNDTTFEEAHTGLADTLIEKEILMKCLSFHKAMPKKVIAVY